MPVRTADAAPRESRKRDKVRTAEQRQAVGRRAWPHADAAGHTARASPFRAGRFRLATARYLPPVAICAAGLLTCFWLLLSYPILFRLFPRVVKQRGWRRGLAIFAGTVAGSGWGTRSLAQIWCARGLVPVNARAN